MNYQGYSGGAVIYKHSIPMFFVDQIMEEFPNTIWVFPLRNIEDIKKSHAKVWNLSDEEINTYVNMWVYLVNDINKRYADSSYIVNTDEIVHGREFKI